MKERRYTVIGLILTGVTGIFTIIFDVDLSSHLFSALDRMKSHEIDKIILPLLGLIPFIFIDLIRKVTAQNVEHQRAVIKEKTRIYNAMVFATQQILNNFTNQIQLFKLKAQDTRDFDRKVLDQCDKAIANTAAQVTSLSQVTDINETDIIKAIEPTFSSKN